MLQVNGYPGLYVVFDGIVGCGKTAQIDVLKERFNQENPGAKVTFTYEPGGTPKADKLREKLKYETLSPAEEVELFKESRSITLPEIVRPILAEGGIVISDRSFTTSLAYQGIGRKFGMERVWKTNREVVDGTFPDIIVYPKVGIDVSLSRSSQDSPDKFDKEGIGFWQRTHKGYERVFDMLHQLSPETNIIQIDDPEGLLSIDDMSEEIRNELYPLIDNWRREGGINRERQL
ncbi:MAG: dTMP kinase [Candidatus Woesebacteria bacterium]|jgi:dTMP kinase